jgi:hypothetical protein
MQVYERRQYERPSVMESDAGRGLWERAIDGPGAME